MGATAVLFDKIERRPPLGQLDESLVADVRAGDDAAFEAIYDRYARGVLAFCVHMLGNYEAAEDALQLTFVSAYRALRETDREIMLRPWLYTIARNRCLSELRSRRGADDVDAVAADRPLLEGLADQVQRREDLREMVEDMQRLPADQRAALVLFELGDHSHNEIAAVLGVRREKVKALIFQAREGLLRGRHARNRPCAEIREHLATAKPRILARSTTRAHIDRCPSCAAFEHEVRHQRAALALILPVVPAVELKASVLGSALSGGSAAAGGGFAAGGGAAASGGVAAGGGAAAAGGSSAVGAGASSSSALIAGATTAAGSGAATGGVAGAGVMAAGTGATGTLASAGAGAASVAAAASAPVTAVATGLTAVSADYAVGGIGGIGATGVVAKILAAAVIATGATGAAHMIASGRPTASAMAKVLQIQAQPLSGRTSMPRSAANADLANGVAPWLAPRPADANASTGVIATPAYTNTAATGAPLTSSELEPSLMTTSAVTQGSSSTAGSGKVTGSSGSGAPPAANAGSGSGTITGISGTTTTILAQSVGSTGSSGSGSAATQSTAAGGSSTGTSAPSANITTGAESAPAPNPTGAKTNAGGGAGTATNAAGGAGAAPAESAGSTPATNSAASDDNAAWNAAETTLAVDRKRDEGDEDSQATADGSASTANPAAGDTAAPTGAAGASVGRRTAGDTIGSSDPDTATEGTGSANGAAATTTSGS